MSRLYCIKSYRILTSGINQWKGTYYTKFPFLNTIKHYLLYTRLYTVYYQIRKFIKLLTSAIRAARCCIVLTSPVISPCTMTTGLYGSFCPDVLLHSSDFFIVIGVVPCVTSPLGHYYFRKYISY